ncbi:hypothetical protein GCM10027416_08630 [Okibacterium endophyticum]
MADSNRSPRHTGMHRFFAALVSTVVVSTGLVLATAHAASAASRAPSGPLADTGFNGTWLWWIAGALVVAGVVVFVLARIRRSKQ